MTAKAGYKRYRMAERGRKPRKLDERIKHTLRRGKPRTPSKELA